MKLEPGAKVWVQLGKRKEAGIILEMVPKSNSIGGYEQCRVQLLAVNPFTPEQLIRSTYPKPVQEHQLTKRYPSEILPGEESEVQS